MAEVARRARPALVFDSDAGCYLVWALAFLEEVLQVESAGKNIKFTIHPKNALPAEPLLQTLDQKECFRGCPAGVRSVLISSDGYTPANLSPPRFRLEIVIPFGTAQFNLRRISYRLTVELSGESVNAVLFHPSVRCKVWTVEMRIAKTGSKPPEVFQ